MRRMRRADPLGLKRALSDRLLPMMVAAVVFLAALALAGALAASQLAERWRGGAAAILTVQVPQPAVALASGQTRIDRVLQVLHGRPEITDVRLMDDGRLGDLLRPWLGTNVQSLALPLPAVVELTIAEDRAEDLDDLDERLAAVAPGTVVERYSTLVRRLTLLARSVQATSAAALAVVVLVAVCVIAVATRSGLAVRREAIQIVHGLGATDGYIAQRFAVRAMVLAIQGAVLGTLLALPVLAGFAWLVKPFSVDPQFDPIWAVLLLLPLATALIGWCTAQMTVRRWLRHLP